MHRVLIVDDSELFLAQLSDELAGLGFEVVGTASRGIEAVTKAHELTPDVILMDILMPGRPDGIEAARTIKDELDIPVIFISAAVDEGIIRRAGAYGFLAKPVDPVELKASIGIAIANQATQAGINEIVRDVVEHTNDLVYVADGKGRLKYVNNQILQIGGYSKEDFIGSDFTSFLTPESAANAAELFKRQVKGEDVGPFELEFVDRSGSLRVLELRERLIWKGGRVVEAHGIGRDVTDRKRAEDEARAAQEQYRLLVENAAEGIAVIQDGAIKYANPALHRLAGYPEGGLAGLPMADFIHPDDRQAVVEGHLRVLAGESDPTPVTRRYLDRGGSVHVIENASMPCTWEGRPAAIVLINDVTQARLAERLLTVQRDIGAVLSAADDLDEAMEGVLERLLTVPGLDCGGIYVTEESGGGLRLAAHRGLTDDFVERVGYFDGQSPEAVTIAEGATVIFPGGEIGQNPDLAYLKDAGIRCLLAVPVLYQDTAVASINAASREMDIVSETVVSAVEDIASRLGTAIRRIRDRELLAESEQKYRTLTENAKEGIAVVQDGVVKYANPTLLALAGYPDGELVGMRFIDFIHPDDRADALAQHAPILTGREARTVMTARYLDAGGVTHVIENTTIPCTWEGRPAGIILFNDVTEARLAEQLLTVQRDIGVMLGTEYELAGAIDQILDRLLSIPGVDTAAIHQIDEADGSLNMAAHRGVAEGFVSRVTSYGEKSPEAREVRAGRTIILNRRHIEADPNLGYIREEGLTYLVAVPVFDKGTAVGSIDIASHTDDAVSRRVVAALEDIAVRLGSAIRRIRNQELLAEWEQKYRTLIDNAKEGIVVVQDGIIRYVNPTGVRISGYSMGELVGRPFSELICPEDLDRVAARYEREMAGEATLEPHAYRVIWKDGTVRWAEGIGVPIEWEGRRASLSFIEDITQQKLVQDALIESEQKFRGVFETARDFMYIASLDGTILDHNRAAKEFFGYTDEEIKHLNLKDLYASPDERERFVEMVVRDGFVENHELKLKKKDGTLIDTLVTVVLRKDAQGNVTGLQGSVKDVTRMKHLERRLVQTEKLTSLGTMVSGIAHELNNPLTGIMGNAEMLSTNASLPPEVTRRIETILSESIRTSKIIKGLLSFAREHKPERRLVSINDCILESYKLREYNLKVSTINVELLLSDQLPVTYADPYQMQQVFVNIINNARDALVDRGGGTITIRSRRQGEWLVVEFQDDGPGINPENLKRVFDPFFTTKEVGKGTGLGLSMAYGIINEHGGMIEAAGAPGGGALFTITIPVTRAPAFAEKTVQVPGNGGQPSKHILVVEDEVHLRDLFLDVLTGRGYTVAAASGAEEAIGLINERGFDAIISDIKMPGPGGVGLYRYVVDTHPDLAGRIIFITGDVLGGETRSFLSTTDCAYLEKPFTINDLLNTLATVLGG